MSLVKRWLSRLPLGAQQELKRLRFGAQIRRGAFATDEAEYGRLAEWVTGGDWVIDAGANVGHYTCRLSQLVGPAGRVLAFEPVPRTFELLAANVAALPDSNVTLFNAAVSEEVAEPRMTMPPFETGLANYYQASIGDHGKGGGEPFAVLSLPVDHIGIPRRVSLVKVDVEGHEPFALRGMRKLLERDHPVLIVEGRSEEVRGFLEGLGYSHEDTSGSPNRIFRPRA
jgi:FkbM family methyltransferase